MPPGWFVWIATETEKDCREIMARAPFPREDLKCLPANKIPFGRFEGLTDGHSNS